METSTIITVLEDMRRAIIYGAPLDSPYLRRDRAEALDRAIAAISNAEKE